jgi:hypothetical protein
MSKQHHHKSLNRMAMLDGITRVQKLGEMAKKSGKRWVSLASVQQVYHNR